MARARRQRRKLQLKLQKKAVESATAKKESCLQELKFAQEVEKGAVIDEKHARKALDSKAGAVSKAKAKYAVEEVGLEKAQKVLEAFSFLKDRPAVVPDDDDEEAAEGADEPPASPSRLASLGSRVSGLFFSPKPEPQEE